MELWDIYLSVDAYLYGTKFIVNATFLVYKKKSPMFNRAIQERASLYEHKIKEVMFFIARPPD